MRTWFQLEDTKWVSVDVISGVVTYAINGELKASDNDPHRDLYGDRLIYSWFQDPDRPRDLEIPAKGDYFIAYNGRPVGMTQIAELLQVMFYRSDARHTTRLHGWEAEALATWVHKRGLTWDVMLTDPDALFTVTSDQLRGLHEQWQDIYAREAFETPSGTASHYLQDGCATRLLTELVSLFRVHSCTPQDELDLLYSFANAARLVWASRTSRDCPSLKMILEEYDRLQALRVYHHVTLREVLDFESDKESDFDD